MNSIQKGSGAVNWRGYGDIFVGATLARSVEFVTMSETKNHISRHYFIADITTYR